MPLVLRRTQGHRRGDWGPHDYDVLDGEREVGRIYRVNAATELWRWAVDFMLIHRNSYGTAESREAAIGCIPGRVCALARGATENLTGESGGTLSDTDSHPAVAGVHAVKVGASSVRVAAIARASF